MILGAVLGLLYTVFDPVRVFCISSNISGRFDLDNLAVLKEMKIYALKLLKRRETGGVFDKLCEGLSMEQESKIHVLQQLLVGLPGNFLGKRSAKLQNHLSSCMGPKARGERRPCLKASKTESTALP